MGCGCLNRELSTYDRIRKLAVKLAQDEASTYVIYKCEMGYNFCPVNQERGIIVEYITKYCHVIQQSK